MGRIRTDDVWEEKASDPLISMPHFSWQYAHTHYRRQEQLQQVFLEESGPNPRPPGCESADLSRQLALCWLPPFT